MSSKYYDDSGKAVYDGDIAYAEDLNTINTAVNTAFESVASDIVEYNSEAAVSASEAAVSAAAAAVSETNAGTSESNASSDASGAAASELAASQYASSASIANTSAEGAAVDAGISESNASVYETSALASKNKAHDWAEEDEDVEVETGEYSAHHWAIKALDAAASISDEAYGPTWNGETTTGPSKNAVYDALEALVTNVGGSSTFTANSTARTIAHGLGAEPTSVVVTASANPGGNLGEVWVTKDATNIYVYNSGSGTTAFNWMAF